MTPSSVWIGAAFEQPSNIIDTITRNGQVEREGIE
jgi:hypothetical protein